MPAEPGGKPQEACESTCESGERWIEQWRRGGDRDECLRQLFTAHFRKVFTFFSGKGFPEEECHDLAQETFLRAFTRLETFRGDARFTTWLFQIMENVRRNALRDQTAQKRQGQEVPLEVFADPESPAEMARILAIDEPGPLERILAWERSSRLREAIQGLPNQMRRCVELRVEQDLKYRDIADVLEVSIDTVKAHLFQARHILRGELGDPA